MAASLAPECNELKEKYDTCFLKWYSEEFLKRNTTTTDGKDKCDLLFKSYQKCLKVALKEKGIDKLVEEAREDQKENDFIHLGKNK